MQPLQIGLGTSSADSSTLKLDYTYNTPGQGNNNGNVLSQNIVIGGTTISQGYTYDALNRLQTSNEDSGASWSQSYGYDRFGNRWVSASMGYTLSPLTPQSQGALNATNNRLIASGYDSAGNQTADAQSRTFTYDAENRQTTFNGATGQYFYDGDGHRVRKIDGSGTTVFVYNSGGQLTAEYHSDPVPPPAGGGGTSYLTTDHLGSTRVVTKSDGTVKARYDYLPFGEELGSGIGQRTTGMGYSLADSTKQKFTEKERDNESGLDYFLARYYSSAQGRFTSVDPLMASARVGTPQSWNRYTYVLNNPLRFIDPDGQDPEENIHKVKTTNTTQVIVQERGGGSVVQQATITITETQTSYVNDNGDVLQTDPVQTSATAANTGGAPRVYTEGQLATMANVAQNIVEVSRAKGFDPAIALGIAQTETNMGTRPSREGVEWKQSDINPMQLSGTSGTRATTDLRSNIGGAIDIYNGAPGRTQRQKLENYNGEKGIKEAYAAAADRRIGQIRSSGSQTVLRVNNWNLRDYRPPRVGPFPNSRPYRP